MSLPGLVVAALLTASGVLALIGGASPGVAWALILAGAGVLTGLLGGGNQRTPAREPSTSLAARREPDPD